MIYVKNHHQWFRNKWKCSTMNNKQQQGKLRQNICNIITFCICHGLVPFLWIFCYGKCILHDCSRWLSYSTVKLLKLQDNLLFNAFQYFREQKTRKIWKSHINIVFSDHEQCFQMIYVKNHYQWSKNIWKRTCLCGVASALLFRRQARIYCL